MLNLYHIKDLSFVLSDLRSMWITMEYINDNWYSKLHVHLKGDVVLESLPYSYSDDARNLKKTILEDYKKIMTKPQK